MRTILVFLALSVSVHAQDRRADKKGTDKKAQKALEYVRKVFAHPKATEETKVQAIKTVSRYQHPDVARELSFYASSHSRAIRITAVRALAKFRKVLGTGQALMDAFSSPANQGKEWTSVRITILQALGQLKYAPAAKLADANIQHDNVWIARAAAATAGLLRQKSSIEALIKELRNLEGDGGKKKVVVPTPDVTSPLAEELTSSSTKIEDVIKYHDQKKPAPKDRREALEAAVHKALRDITRRRFPCADAWEDWWRKVKSKYKVPK